MAAFSQFSTAAELKDAPIEPCWIRQGKPRARNLMVAGSTDRSAYTMLWDCTAGKFNWVYSVDETVHVLDGAVTITTGGRTRTLHAGDIAFFAAGTTALWQVDFYVKKLAFCQAPLPRILHLPLRLLGRFARLWRKGTFLIEDSLAASAPQKNEKAEPRFESDGGLPTF